MSEINYTMLDWKQHLQHIKDSRKAQRNWDHSRQLPDETVQFLIDVATNAPAKQDEAFFNLYVVTNRDHIHELYKDHSWGFNNGVDVNYRNPQVDGHALFVYTRNPNPNSQRNAYIDETLKTEAPFSRAWVNCLTAIGISSGYLSLTASMLGLSVGYNKNFFFQPQSHDRWCEILGHKEPCHPDADPDSYTWGQSEPPWQDPISGGGSTIVHTISVGYPDTSIKWYQSKDTQYISSDPSDKIDGTVDSLTMPGIVHELDQEVIEFGPWSHDAETGESVDRPHRVKWIK